MRVLSKHEAVHICVADVPYFVEFTEERPGVFAADVEDDVALHLLQRVGEPGGFWTDWVEGTTPQEAADESDDEDQDNTGMSGHGEQSPNATETETAIVAKPKRKKA